jgi:Cu+-exporting ATPase
MLKAHTNSLLCLVAGALMAFGAGCATTGPASTSAGDLGPVAECPICRANADLACLCVHVKDSTPKAEYQGKTYYFCSQECCDEFVANPAKFAGK